MSKQLGNEVYRKARKGKQVNYTQDSSLFSMYSKSYSTLSTSDQTAGSNQYTLKTL